MLTWKTNHIVSATGKLLQMVRNARCQYDQKYSLAECRKVAMFSFLKNAECVFEPYVRPGTGLVFPRMTL